MNRYKNRFFFRLLLCVSISLPYGIIQGWGFEAHNRINREAVNLVPGVLGAYLSQNIEFISQHAIDPDIRKNGDPDEGYGHYIDADYYGEYPFSNIPHTLDSVTAVYGSENVRKWGIAPWRIEEFYKRLVKQFRDEQWNEANLTASALGHYVADIHMPFHVVANYNGQLTGNEGIHSHWETQMVNKYLLEKIDPAGKLILIDDPVETAFTIVVESYPLHFQLLRADSLARKDLTENQKERLKNWQDAMDDTDYHKILLRETGDIAKERMELAAIRIASFWNAAWIEAGKPTPPKLSSK